MFKFRSFLTEFLPQTYHCFKEGYSKKRLLNDVGAGAILGVIALPLAMAFAMGSGVDPDRGLYTAIIAGFLISLLGGSRYQIGGPTGAFIVIVYDIVQRQGYDGLVVATLLAGVILIIMGLLRAGTLLKFMPYPVVTGFTSGIALLIFSAQIKDFFQIPLESVPVDFFHKWQAYGTNIGLLSLPATLIAAGSLIFILAMRKFFPRMPGAILAVGLSAFAVYFFELPVETIEQKFGHIPRTLPSLHFPSFSLAALPALIPDAITIAILAGIESLLSAVIADGMSGHTHKSNTELMAQGVANIGAVLFGGIPATGAIARTATNVRLGATSPISGMVHAVTLLLLMFCVAPLAGKIPLCSLAALLIVVSYGMAEIPQIVEIFRASWRDAVLWALAFSLTVLVDMTVAVEVGVLVAALLFMKRMADVTQFRLYKKSVKDDLQKSDASNEISHPEGVLVFEVTGPLFFGAADLLSRILLQRKSGDKIYILRMLHVFTIDATGLRALRHFVEKCRKAGIAVFFAEVQGSLQQELKRAQMADFCGKQNFYMTVDEALEGAGALLAGASKIDGNIGLDLV